MIMTYYSDSSVGVMLFLALFVLYYCVLWMLRSKLSIYSLENEPLLDRFDLGSETEEHPCKRGQLSVYANYTIQITKLFDYRLM